MAAQIEVEVALPTLNPDEEQAASVGWPVDLDAYGATHAGRIRPRNEDHFLIAEYDRNLLIRECSVDCTAPTRWRTRRQAALLAVADGMGGHAAGSTASQVVLDSLAGHLLHQMPWPGSTAQALAEADDQARSALSACQVRLTEVADEAGLLAGQPGTTLTAIFITWPELLLLHVGDSRAYLLRQGKLSQLTTDHTATSSPEHREKRDQTSPIRHVLTNAIMSGAEQTIGDLRSVTLELEDRLLLCTDGLTEHVSDGELTEILAEQDAAEPAVGELLRRALSAGGTDNITALVARFLPRA
jgi:protein phosphatase